MITFPDQPKTDVAAPVRVLRDLVAGGTATTRAADLTERLSPLPPIVVGEVAPS
jgi:hypothetical protein